MLRIDPGSGAPPYEQLRNQLVEQIVAGDLAPGTKLPAVRRLASDLGLAPNTVARTYRELETAGYVLTAGRNGTVVATPNDGPAEVAAKAEALARTYVLGMRALGLDGEAIIAQLRRAMIEA